VTRLENFVARFGALLATGSGEDVILRTGGRLLEDLIARDDWLPEAFSQPHPERYTQYLLHLEARFSVVSFVWGPGQKTPIHDHTVWGLVGVLRGAELSQRFALRDESLMLDGDCHRLERGQVEAVSPRVGDIHQVCNAFADRTSISIHVYGGDIGKIRRHTFLPDGTTHPFVSGYANVQEDFAG
jgi:predicted metal-dependent enzyme (double-stranded beta helix superfamily)